MELAPPYRAKRHRRHASDSIDLAMKSRSPAARALFIDTAIESQEMASEADRAADLPK
jgi:hypothetical protein